MDETKNHQQPMQDNTNQKQPDTGNKSLLTYIKEGFGLTTKTTDIEPKSSAAEFNIETDIETTDSNASLITKKILISKAQEIGTILQKKLTERSIRIAKEMQNKKTNNVKPSSSPPPQDKANFID